MDLASLLGDVVMGIAFVIFDVALVVVAVGAISALELGEDFLVGLVQKVSQYVEPTAMGHADDHLFDA